jgi:protein-disulfide isomerase
MNPSKNNPIYKDRKAHIPQEIPDRLKKPHWLLLVLVLVAGVLGAIVLLNTNGEAEEISTPAQRAIGPQTAPVTITEYGDFGCISCKAWHQFGIREQVLERYGEQVRFVWRDFPVTAPQSPQAAEAGLCAHDQGHFWAYHAILFANAPALGEGNLKVYAAEIGLDTQTFNSCLETGVHRSVVEQERTSALQQGFRSVPSFMVNDQRLIGPPSFDQLVAMIDEILASVD